MTSTDHDTISVVICTFERPDACERALRSVLDQTDEPLEVLVCDDGSADHTPARFREWERRCEKVRYLPLPNNTGSPGPARNLGIAHARGDWIAFLDDDDEWLPDKLARQRAAISTATADVIATNAFRSDGSVYFPDAPPSLRPTRADLLTANPVIISSAVVRRCFAGFPTDVWGGVEDYAAWLALADRGARFLILGEPLLHYQDASSERMSAARVHMGLASARLAWQRAARRPIDPANLTAAVRKTAEAMYLVGSERFAGLRDRARRSPSRS